MRKFGIDVSKWQGTNFNFSKAKSEDGVEFVILRGAYAFSKDALFEKFYSKCKALNLPVGVYQYSMATTVSQAKEEAEYLYSNVLKGKQFELPIYIDVEDRKQLALAKDSLTEIVKAWCEYLESRGYFVGIYASTWTLMSEVNDAELTGYSHWVAQWAKTPTYTGKYGMWQFGGEANEIRTTQIAGQTVDQNYMYEDFPTIIKNAKLNGFGTAAAKPATVVEFEEGDKVTLAKDATYYNGVNIPAWVKNTTLYVRSEEFENGDYFVSTLKTGAITGRVNKKYIKKA